MDGHLQPNHGRVSDKVIRDDEVPLHLTFLFHQDDRTTRFERQSRQYVTHTLDDFVGTFTETNPVHLIATLQCFVREPRCYPTVW
jgi:hypothetical protein